MSSLIQPSHGPSGVGRTSAPKAARGSRPAQATASMSASEAPVSLDTVPSTPPASVLDQIEAADNAWKSLHAQGFEVRYSHDPQSRRTTATLHDSTGAAVRTLTPTEAVELAAGGGWVGTSSEG